MQALDFAQPQLEISDTNPRDPRAWVEQTDKLKSFDFERGSPDEIEQSEAATGTAVVDNQGGPFATLQPMRSVRLSAQSDTGTAGFTMRQSHIGEQDPLRGGILTFSLFDAYIQNAPQSWPDPSDAVALVGISLADAFEAFATPEFAWGQRYVTLDPGPDDWPCGFPSGTNITPDVGPPFIPDELTGSRVHRVLDCLSWPTDRRIIDAGTVTILGSDGSNNFKVQDNALSHLRQIALTEGGLIFMDKEGNVRFIDADHLPAPGPEIYGDVDGETRYQDVETDRSVGRVWNQVTIDSTESQHVAALTAEDATSIAKYVERPKTFTLLPVSGTVMAARRDAILARYGNAIERITSMTIKPRTGIVFRQVMRHEKGDRVLARRRPLGAATIEQESRIEQIQVQAPVSEEDPFWTFTFGLSAV